MAAKTPDERPVAVVTGAARGIGRRVAITLAERGFAIALNDLEVPDGVISGIGGDILTIPGDVSGEDDVKRMSTSVMERFGRVDALVNNAGISAIIPAEDTPTDLWRRTLDINLTGPFLMCREFGKLMLERGSGSIVNISSVAGLVGISDRAAYNASKHGLVGLTRTLAGEWGGRGVRVNAVCPGWVKTEMDSEDQAGGGYVDSDITGRTPMNRFARPEDIANAVAFLCDPVQSAYVNGHTLSVDGGWFGDGSWESLRIGKQAGEGSR